MLRPILTDNILIISTQTPTGTSTLGLEVGTFAPGQTGVMLHSLTGGGLIYIHRDKQLRDEEVAMLKTCLRSQTTVFITGHGGDGEVSGQYISTATEETLDIKCSAEDYAKLLLSANTLKAGDHINLMLFVCYGGKNLHGEKSFAEKLAQELIKAGITSNIIASADLVSRIENYDPRYSDIPNHLLKFRTEKSAVLYFVTDSSGITKSYQGNKDVYITKRSITFDPENEMVLAALRSAFGNMDGIKQEYLNLKAEEAYVQLKLNKLLIIFRRSSSLPNTITITYYNPDKNNCENIQLSYSRIGDQIIFPSDKTTAFLTHLQKIQKLNALKRSSEYPFFERHTTSESKPPQDKSSPKK